MNHDPRIAKIEQVIEPVLVNEDLELVGIELNREAVGLVLRIFLDSKEGSIDLDKIAKASRAINPLLDKAGLIEQKYILEISSPGIERPLSKPDHFRRFEGSKVFVRTKRPIKKRRQFKGKLIETGADSFVIETDGGTYKIAYENVSKARLQVDVEL